MMCLEGIFNGVFTSFFLNEGSYSYSSHYVDREFKYFLNRVLLEVVLMGFLLLGGFSFILPFEDGPSRDYLCLGVLSNSRLSGREAFGGIVFWLFMVCWVFWVDERCLMSATS